MPSSRLENFFLNTYHLLIVTIQEIDHQALYAPLFIESKSLFHRTVFFDPVNSLVSGSMTEQQWIDGIKSASDQMRANIIE